MKHKKVLGALTALSTLAVVLAACGNNSSKSSSSNSSSSSVAKFPSKVTNNKSSVKGGNLSVAEVSDTPFTGIFDSTLADSAIDSDIASPGNESLFKINSSYKIVDGGAANLKLNVKAKTATITINPKVKWSDGKPLVAQDVLYSYEIIANKATNSTRYTGSLQDIVGLADYHDGKSKTISGIKLPDGPNGRKVVIHFQEMKPGMTQSGNGYIWETASPYHYLKDVAFNKLSSSTKIRKNPLYYGPYKLAKLVSGQSVKWVPNTYYYGTKPKLSSITYQVVSPDQVTEAIKTNKYDIASVTNSQWTNVKNAQNTNFIANIPLYYSYLAFKVGKWDSKKGVNVQNSKAKMANRSLRQAIAYAMNIDQVAQKYNNGLSFRINTLIPSQFNKFYDSKSKGFPYNLKKANQILDKAGYKKGKDGYRTTPSGKKLTIHLACMSGSKVQEPIVQNYIQQWKKIGLRVQLTTGRLIEFNSFYQKIQNDNKDIDMFMAAWSLSSEPSPNDLYSASAPYNFSRMNTKENTKLLKEIDSQKAFNEAYRIKAFHQWQEYMNKEAYVVPLTNAYSVTAVNKRVKGYSLVPSTTPWNGVSVTSNTRS